MKESTRSLKTNFIIIFLFLSLLPISIDGYISYIVANDYRNSIEENMLMEATLQVDSLNQWFEERESDVVDMAIAISAVDMEQKATQQIVEEYKEACGELCSSVVVLDKEGVSYADYHPETVGINSFAGLDYFEASIRGDIFYSEIQISPIDGASVVVISSPITLKNGEINGIVFIPILTNYISEVMENSMRGDTGDSYLINQNGYLVTQPRFWDTMTAETGIDTDYTVYQLENDVTRKALTGESGIEIYSNYAQDDVIGAYLPLENNHGVMFLEYQTDEIHGSINSLTIVLSLVFIFTAISVIIISLLMTNSLVRPIRLLTKIGQQISVGDVEIDQADVDQLENACKRKDEIGVIARVFRGIPEYFLEMANVAEGLADGDLTLSVSLKGEKDVLGSAHSKMLSGLKQSISNLAECVTDLGGMAKHLSNAADQAGQATNQIASTMQHVAQGTNQQSQAAGQTANAVEQMDRSIQSVAEGAQEQASAISRTSHITAQLNSAIQQVSENADAVTQSSVDAAEAAKVGNQTVSATIAGMDSIRTRVNLSAQKVSEMGERSLQISSIVETIEDIASQTNLLALNAAIEAARAGEQGKGFAVVADEVRKLAERSSSSTKEISGLITGIQNTVEEAIQAMNEGSREVDQGVELAGQAGQSLEKIQDSINAVNEQAQAAMMASREMKNAADELVDAVDSVSAVVEENTAATEQMTANSVEVTSSIENIASVSEENSAAVEEVSASTQEMSAQVQEVYSYSQSLAEMVMTLQDIVSKFTLSSKELQADSRSSETND